MLEEFSTSPPRITLISVPVIASSTLVKREGRVMT